MLSRIAFSSKLMLLVGFALGILMLGLGQISVPVAKADGSVVTLEGSSTASPALVTFNGRLYVAWTDSASSINLNSSSDGINFGSKVTLGESSSTAPALAAFNGRLYLAWTDSSQHINVMSSSDGTIFGGKVTLGESSSTAPALAAFNGRLYLAWTGTDDAHSLQVMSSSDAVIFGNKATLAESSSAAPALAGSSSMLLLAWTGTDGAHSLHIASSSDGITFSGKATLGESSSAAPALAGSASGFSLAWTGSESAHFLNLIRTLGGAKETLSDNSNVAPALTIFNSQLALAWTGTDSENHLKLRSLDLAAAGQPSTNSFTWQWPAVPVTSTGQICLPIIGCIQMGSVNQTQAFPADLADGVQRLGVQSVRLASGNLPNGLNLNVNISARSATLSGNVSGNVNLNLAYDLLNSSSSKVGTLTVFINIVFGSGPSPTPSPTPSPPTCNPCTLDFVALVQVSGGSLTNVSGVTIAVNGVNKTTPFTISAAFGSALTLQAQASVTYSGVTYNFAQWRSSVTGFISNQNPMSRTVDRSEQIQAVYAQGGGSGGTIQLKIRAIDENGADLSGDQIPTITSTCCGGKVMPPVTLNIPSGTSLALTAPGTVGGGGLLGSPFLNFQHWEECFGNVDCLVISNPSLVLNNLTMSAEVRARYRAPSTIKITIRATNDQGQDLSGDQTPTIETSCCGDVTPPVTLTLSSGTDLTLTAPGTVGGGGLLGSPILTFQKWCPIFVGEIHCTTSTTWILNNLTESNEFHAIYK